MQVFQWAVQALILTAGIHLFLRFVRNTRGNRLIRGFFISVLVGFVGLWGLSTAFELEELKQILKGSTGFMVIGLAIIFQSELRRGIAQLGESSFPGGRLRRATSADTVRQVVQAARSMALRREGALIAFERETSLQPYIETGTRFASDVHARLVESLFHSGGALHDGAVIVRKDRIAAAGCFLPLPDHAELDASLGTRHRAALGLAEESDAVVLVVSEETGSISLARESRLRPHIDPEKLEDELRALLEATERAKETRHGPLYRTFDFFRREAVWLAGSLALGAGVLYVAHMSIQETRRFSVRIVEGGSDRRTPQEGELLVYAPVENVRLRETSGETQFKVAVTGTRSLFDELGGNLRGTVEIDDAEWDTGPLDMGLVRWENSVLGLGYRWENDRIPELEIERFDTKWIQLRPEDVTIVDDRLNSRYEILTSKVSFEPSANLQVEGPVSLLDELGDSLPLNLQEIALGPSDLDDVRRSLRLSSELAKLGFSLSEPVEVIVPIVPLRRQIGTIEKDIALVCLSPEKMDELGRWSLPVNALTARFTIITAGLVPLNADPRSPARIERLNAIQLFVEENLRVFVDVAELPPEGEGRSVPIRWHWRKEWRESLEALGLDAATLGDREELDVRLEDERSILLEPSSPTQPDIGDNP